MRGTPEPGEQTHRRIGITPAHAGNTCKWQAVSRVFRDHPRTCGEHAAERNGFDPRAGSPPHMRGTLHYYAVACCSGRITPAHAGNTATPQPIGTVSWDHPRTCGEHYIITPSPVVPVGSPPHMRGTPKEEEDDNCYRGITPAHAGNT